jgi:general secretion pathway protein L
MAETTWGFDLGSTAMKAVRLTRTWKGFRLAEYSFLPTKSADEAGEREKWLQGLHKIFPDGGRNGSEVILSIPSHRTMVHRVKLPFKERGKNSKIIRFEVEPLLPLPIEQVVVDFYPLKNGEENQSALVFAVPKEEVKKLLALFQEARLDPESIIPEALSLMGLAQELPEDSTPRVILDLGHEKTTCVVWSNKALRMTRSISLGGASLNRAIGKEFGTQFGAYRSWKDAEGASQDLREAENAFLGRLAGEIQRTLEIYESGPGGQPVGQIFLTGGLASIPGIAQVLEKNFKKPVLLLSLQEPFRSLLREVPEEYRSPLLIALGSAFLGLRNRDEWVDLRQNEFASSKKIQKEKARSTLILTYGVILAFLGAATFFIDLYIKERRLQYLKDQIRTEFTQALPGVKRIVNEIQQMRSHVSEEKARVEALGGYSSVSSSLEILRELSQAIDPSWKIRVTEFLSGTEEIEVNGEADSFDTLNKLKSKLDQVSQFQDVQLKTARSSTLENLIEFKLRMKRRM